MSLKHKANKKINTIISNYKINASINLKDYIGKVDYTKSIFDYSKSIDENKKNLIFINKFESSISSDLELQSKVNQYIANDNVKIIDESLKINKFLKEIYIDKTFVSTFNDLIEEYNNLLENIRIQETKFKENGKPEDVRKWIEVGLNLHLEKNHMYFLWYS